MRYLPLSISIRFVQKPELGPEKSLVLAVLEDAVISYQKYRLAKSVKGRATFDHAEEWLLDDDGAERSDAGHTERGIDAVAHDISICRDEN